MSGIYFHIPYCSQACHYCDFHFSTNLKNKTAMVKAIVHELGLRKDYFLKSPTLDHSTFPAMPSQISTVYFGGGTPSLLSREELTMILEATKENFGIDNVTEQTIECNPEDLSIEKLVLLKVLGFNRLSIGIQTFQDSILQYINRAHNANQARNAAKWAKEVGFENITVDLIYALPNATAETLLKDIEEILLLEIPHISAYCLTVEEKTVFGKWEKQKKLKSQDEDFEKEQYLLLTDTLSKNGYEQYEISNFARGEKYSQHNSAYWFGHHYLGIGPGAHSFNGHERQWNISNNAEYINKIDLNVLPMESELLSNSDRINETLLTQLRTKWGVDLGQIERDLFYDLSTQKAKEISLFLQNGWIRQQGKVLTLTKEGKLLGDKIVAELMV